MVSGDNPLTAQMQGTEMHANLNEEIESYKCTRMNRLHHLQQKSTELQHNDLPQEIMGNCLVLQEKEKVIKVMRPGGKILEYGAPINVQQVLSDFSGHVISDSFPALRYLLPDTKLIRGQLYYLIPLPKPSPEGKKKVRFCIPEEEHKQETGVVRIKLVISKQQLQEMLQKGGVSVDDMVSQLKEKQQRQNVDASNNDDKMWKPVLESIPEVD